FWTALAKRSDDSALAAREVGAGCELGRAPKAASPLADSLCHRTPQGFTQKTHCDCRQNGMKWRHHDRLMKPPTHPRFCFSWLCACFLAASFPAQYEQKIPEQHKVGGFYIGSIAYTFDRWPMLEALEKIAECGGTVVELSAKPSLSKAEPNIPFDYRA